MKRLSSVYDVIQMTSVLFFQGHKFQGVMFILLFTLMMRGICINTHAVLKGVRINLAAVLKM